MTSQPENLCVETIHNFNAVNNQIGLELEKQKEQLKLERLALWQRAAIIFAIGKRRIALGSGTQIQDVNKLLKQFTQMQKMMKKMSGKGGMQKMMRSMKGMMPPGGGGMGGMFGGR